MASAGYSCILWLLLLVRWKFIHKDIEGNLLRRFSHEACLIPDFWISGPSETLTFFSNMYNIPVVYCIFCAGVYFRVLTAPEKRGTKSLPHNISKL